MKHLLAIDPGSVKIGYAVFRYTTNSLEPVELGTKYLTNVMPNGEEVTMYVRLERARQFIDSLCQKYNFTEAAIEEAFTDQKNLQSSIKLATARGVIISPLLMHGVPISEYSAKTVKAKATGNGSADKKHVIHIMKLEFSKSGLVDKLQEDAADALAIGKTHHIMSHSGIAARVSTMESPNKVNQGAFRKDPASKKTKRSGAKSSRSAMEEHLLSRNLLR